MSINLYHNSMLVEDTTPDGSGYDLGPGWSVSYSAKLILNALTGDITVLHDDGRRDVMTETQTGVYEGGPGVFNVLYTTSTGWKLLHKDQSWRNFDANGLLSAVVDASGNRLEIFRDGDDRIDYVLDASCRRVTFVRSNGVLERFRDDHANSDYERVWPLDYDINGSLERVTEYEEWKQAGPQTREMTYDAAGRIETFTDRNGHTFEFTYASSCFALCPVVEVRDPEPLNSQTRGFVLTQNGISTTMVHTDRRGKIWTYHFDAGALDRFENPLNDAWVYGRDVDLNVTDITTPLADTWSYTYDDRGNMLTASNPADQTTTYTYDQWNNLTGVTDANGHATTYVYAGTSGFNPTLLLEIHEPADGQGGSEAVTTFSYHADALPDPYSCEEESYRGLLESVTDANGVVTVFEYDDWGQLSNELADVSLALSGGPTYQIAPLSPRTVSTKNDNGDQIEETKGDGGGGKAGRDVDARGNKRFQESLSHSPAPTGAMWLDDMFVPASFPALPSQDDDTYDTDHLSVYSSYFNYTGEGRLKNADTSLLKVGDGSGDRALDISYDPLGRVKCVGITSNEATSPPLIPAYLATTYTYADTNGEFTVETDEGQTITTTLDDAGRTWTVDDGSVIVTYSYLADHRVSSIHYDLGAYNLETTYDYHAHTLRLANVYHKVNGTTTERRTYVYDPGGRVTGITAYEHSGSIVDITYDYDNRNRLIQETRDVLAGVGMEYDIAYKYDQLGNRTARCVQVNGGTTADFEYHYAYEDSELYGSNANRLTYYKMTQGEVIETVWYYYNDRGNVRRIVAEREGERVLRGLRFDFDKAGRVWRVLSDEWEDDETPDYQRNWMREFRYDSARQRYASIDLEPDLNGFSGSYFVNPNSVDYKGSGSYHYSGNDILADYRQLPAGGGSAIVEERTRYSLGLLENDLDSNGNVIQTRAPRPERLGNITSTADATAVPPVEDSEVVYTAFGEIVALKGSAPFRRYGYVGAHGYQQHDAEIDGFGDGTPDNTLLRSPVDGFPYLHVGHRYYDPTTSRFLQRDPIGLGDGMNPYQYASGSPTQFIDPSGLLIIVTEVTPGKPIGTRSGAGFVPVGEALILPPPPDIELIRRILKGEIIIL